VFGGDLLPLPVHSGGAFVVHLHAVHPEIALSRSRVARGHARQGNEASGILRPALQDREVEHREILALDHFLAGPVVHGFRKKLARLRKQGQHLDLIEEPLRGFHIHEHPNTRRNFVVGIHSHGQLHARFRAELVDQKLRSTMAFQILK
jgi:hypothetical protein